MSINSSVLRLGQTLGPLISGIVITRLGEEYVFIFGALFAIAAAVFAANGIHEMGRLERK
jgi:predicted MFS family arabinose efflux permease